jgi:hypothetical protein
MPSKPMQLKQILISINSKLLRGISPREGSNYTNEAPSLAHRLISSAVVHSLERSSKREQPRERNKMTDMKSQRKKKSKPKPKQKTTKNGERRYSNLISPAAWTVGLWSDLIRCLS